MEKEAFIKAMDEAPDKFNERWMAHVIVNTVNAERTDDGMSSRNRQLIIAIEELSELTKELTKALRGMEDRVSIIEELADVDIVWQQIALIFNVKSTELAKATNVKLKRIEDKLKSDGIYQ